MPYSFVKLLYTSHVISRGSYQCLYNKACFALKLNVCSEYILKITKIKANMTTKSHYAIITFYSKLRSNTNFSKYYDELIKLLRESKREEKILSFFFL